MDNRFIDNVLDSADETTDETGTGTSPIPEHLDELPDIENVEEYVGEDHVYDEETAGALAALMFSKMHPEESASKVAADALEEASDTPKQRMSPLVVLIVISTLLLEFTSAYLSYLPMIPNAFLADNSVSGENSFELIYEYYPMYPGDSGTDRIAFDIKTDDDQAFKWNESALGVTSKNETVFSNAGSGSETITGVVTEFGNVSSSIKDYVGKDSAGKDSVGKDPTGKDSENNASSDISKDTVHAEYGNSIKYVIVSEAVTTPVKTESVATPIQMGLATTTVVLQAVAHENVNSVPNRNIDLGNTTTIRLACLYELLVLGRLKKRDAEDEETDEEDAQCFGDDNEAEC